MNTIIYSKVLLTYFNIESNIYNTNQLPGGVLSSIVTGSVVTPVICSSSLITISSLSVSGCTVPFSAST